MIFRGTYAHNYSRMKAVRLRLHFLPVLVSQPAHGQAPALLVLQHTLCGQVEHLSPTAPKAINSRKA